MKKQKLKTKIKALKKELEESLDNNSELEEENTALLSKAIFSLPKHLNTLRYERVFTELFEKTEKLNIEDLENFVKNIK